MIPQGFYFLLRRAVFFTAIDSIETLVFPWFGLVSYLLRMVLTLTWLVIGTGFVIVVWKKR